MKSLILIIISGALINNVVLNQFLGICSFLGVSKQMKASASLGMAVVFVITIASAVASLLYDHVLAPLGMDFMKTIVFILVIAALVQIVEMFLKKTSPSLYKGLGVYLPLITTNCAVLGVTINNIIDGYNFVESMASSLGCGLGFLLAMVLFSGVRSRINEANIPAPFKGLAVTLIAASFLSLAFMGFSGIVENIFA